MSNSFSHTISRNFPLHYISKSVNKIFLHAHFSQCTVLYIVVSRIFRMATWLKQIAYVIAFSKLQYT
jgi:hypothetical protein